MEDKSSFWRIGVYFEEKNSFWTILGDQFWKIGVHLGDQKIILDDTSSF